jgi:hypothetical protein
MRWINSFLLYFCSLGVSETHIFVSSQGEAIKGVEWISKSEWEDGCHNMGFLRKEAEYSDNECDDFVCGKFSLRWGTINQWLMFGMIISQNIRSGDANSDWDGAICIVFKGQLIYDSTEPRTYSWEFRNNGSVGALPNLKLNICDYEFCSERAAPLIFSRSSCDSRRNGLHRSDDRIFEVIWCAGCWLVRLVSKITKEKEVTWCESGESGRWTSRMTPEYRNLSEIPLALCTVVLSSGRVKWVRPPSRQLPCDSW